MMKPWRREARSDIGQVDDRAAGRSTVPKLGLAEHHIGLAGIAAAVVAVGRADDQVVEAVAVDVAGRGDAAAGLVAVGIALDDEAVAPA